MLKNIVNVNEYTNEKEMIVSMHDKRNVGIKKQS